MHPIIAIEPCRWYPSNDNSAALDHPPIPGFSYRIGVGSQYETVSEPFWVIYMAPLPTFNGFDSEEDIASIRFCLCEKEMIVGEEEHCTIMQVKVLEVESLNGSKGSPEVLPQNSWFDMAIHPEHPPRGYTWNLEHYSTIGWSAQSDIGSLVILEKRNRRSRIVAAYDWAMSGPAHWYLYNIPFSAEEEKKYNIQHFPPKD